ncbi:MAG: cysteine hydrolase [Uliginosibacterium sp.]|nr:cysteine hydrolase [Uliginosibacterium sp.]
MKTALILIDIQNDYFPGGAMTLLGADAAAAHAAELLRVFRQRQLAVVHIQHIANRPGASFFLPGTPGAEIHAALSPVAGEAVFQKSFPSSFRDTPLLTHLRSENITRLYLAGMMTHMCVDTTVRAAFDLGFSCCLAHDACATRDLSFDGQLATAAQVQTAYLAALNGLFAQVKSSTELIAAL